MFDLVLGLPLHILVIHAVVVLGPISALAAIAYALLARARQWLAWPLVATAAVTAVTAWVAHASGERLEARVVAGLGEGSASPADAALVHAHTEAGSLAFVVCLLFAAWVLGCVLWLLRPGRPAVLGGRWRGAFPIAVRTLLVLAGLAALAAVVYAGHTGAAASWASLVG